MYLIGLSASAAEWRATTALRFLLGLQFPSERQLPPMFRDPSSDLFVSQRNPAMNSGAGSLPAWAVDYSAGLAKTISRAAAVRSKVFHTML